MEFTEIKNVKITGTNSEGKGVGRSESFNKVLFVKNAVIDEIVDVKIVKEEKSFAIAEITNIVLASKFKTESKCQHYGICGGCNVQHVTYEGQLSIKQKQVEDAFKRLAKQENPNILSIIPSKKEFEYRNKMDFQFSNLSWIVNEGEEKVDVKSLDRRVLGLHVEGRFDRVLNIEKCLLQSEKINVIRNFIRDFALKAGATFYNPKYKNGIMRNVIFRTNTAGQLMILLIFAEPPRSLQADLCMALKKTFPEITSLFWGVNKKENDTIEETKLFAFIGEDYLQEDILGLKFKINAKSFAQVNTEMFSEIVSKVLEIGNFKETDVVYDLYSGIGSFALPIAQKVAKVIGVEISKFSYADAKENAILNEITNVKFAKGDVAEVLTEDFIAENGTCNAWVMDPPRSGLSSKVIGKIIEFLPEKIIYVSCNPATLARDFALISTNYKLVKALPLDMFPQTSHVETICLLEKIA